MYVSDSWTRYEYCYTECNHTEKVVSRGTVFPLIILILVSPPSSNGYLLRLVGLFLVDGCECLFCFYHTKDATLANESVRPVPASDVD